MFCTVVFGMVKTRVTQARERKQGQRLLMCAVLREGGLGGVEGVKSDLCCDWLISMLKCRVRGWKTCAALK